MKTRNTLTEHINVQELSFKGRESDHSPTALCQSDRLSVNILYIPWAALLKTFLNGSRIALYDLPNFKRQSLKSLLSPYIVKGKGLIWSASKVFSFKIWNAVSEACFIKVVKNSLQDSYIDQQYIGIHESTWCYMVAKWCGHHGFDTFKTNGYSMYLLEITLKYELHWSDTCSH